MENLFEEKKEKIIGLLRDEKYKPMKKNELAQIMEVKEEELELFYSVLEDLEKTADITITKKARVILSENLGFIKGTFVGNSAGFGFVVPSNKKLEDVFIPASMVNSAINKDLVLCKVNISAGYDKRAEGEILKVTERVCKEIVGTFQRSRNFGFVVADDKKISKDIYISLKNSLNAKDGEKVSAKIIQNNKKEKNLEGKITEILGDSDNPFVKVTGVIKQHNIKQEFPEEVLNEAKYIEDEIRETDCKNRKDLRDELIITIDGEDTKDVDDAISLKLLENGNYSLGVHIADVTHYVKEGSPLDVEALERGTSVYLPDRVIPMLPQKLSNGICSLNPNVSRLSLSCIMEINQKGFVVKHEIAETVIKTTKKMTYTIVNDMIINGKESEFFKENIFLEEMLINMKNLAEILRDKRIKRGAIEFDFPETKILVNEDGKAVDIVPYSRNIATGIIEEFMLVCNETVSEEYFWLEMPFVYRTHEEPDSEKMRYLAEFVRGFGYRLKGNGTHPGSLQALLSKIESSPEESIISRVVLRSFKQARYTHENLGHFGLAAKYYSHFTSPIRRYPDLQIHRIIKENLKGKNQEFMNRMDRLLESICKKCSIAERNAELCEREVNNIKKVEFMADKVGQEFDGIISGVTARGIYVELPNTVEGFVSLQSVRDDYYVFDKERLKLIGERKKNVFSLGDSLKVMLLRADDVENKLDFIIVEKDME